MILFDSPPSLSDVLQGAVLLDLVTAPVFKVGVWG